MLQNLGNMAKRLYHSIQTLTGVLLLWAMSPVPLLAAGDEDTILSENFDKMTAGTNDSPDTQKLSNCFSSDQDSIFIPNIYTQTPGWSGFDDFQAGGAIALIPQAYGGTSTLNTPLANYSGDITVSFKYKPVDDDDPYNNFFYLSLCKGQYIYPEYVEDEYGDEIYTVEYFSDGADWKTFTYTVKNVDTDEGQYFQINTYQGILIDDFTVKSAISFIPSPTFSATTDVTDSAFTANWVAARGASAYQLKLFRKAYKSENRLAVNEPFTKAELPTDWQWHGRHASPSFTKTDGEDATQALCLQQGDTVTFNCDWTKYQECSFWMKTLKSMNDNGYVYFETLEADHTWSLYAMMPVNNLTGGFNMNFDQQTGNKFMNKHYGVRIYTVGMADSCTLVLDNVHISGGCPASLEEVSDKVVTTSDTYYRFSGLSPEDDYWLSVQAFGNDMQSGISWLPVNVLARPVTETSSDLAEDHYTAHWRKVPKADRYKAEEFEVYTADKDEDDYSVMEEEFGDAFTGDDDNKIVSLNNSDVIDLDSLTGYAGWTGRYTLKANGRLGCEQEETAFLRTPILTLGNSDKVKVALKLSGYPDDAVILSDGTSEYRLTFDANGEYDDTLTIDAHGNNTQFTLRCGGTDRLLPFMVDYFLVYQNLKAGDKVYEYLGCKYTEDDGTAVVMDLHDNYLSQVDSYAYSVVAYRDYEGGVVSDHSEPQMLSKATTAIVTPSARPVSDAVEIFNLSGQRISRTQHGVNIIRHKDGTSHKVIR